VLILEQYLKKVYQVVSPDEEFPELLFNPDTDAETEDQFLELLNKNRQRDRLLKSTQQGPHRDDLTIRLESRKARDYASEGQQRSMIISLKVAQLKYLHETSGILPVLLADDVLGELDKGRKNNFWKAVGNDVQVIGSGTEVPSMETRGKWQVFEVSDGEFFPLT
jgi:DNA replication and repair protein RecF